MKATHFWDMHSGGSQKLDWDKIVIEAPQAEAEIVFYNRFNRNPNRVTCSCCGSDYSISEFDSLAEAENYQKGNSLLVIKSDEIKDSERVGDVPSEGYVWC